MFLFYFLRKLFDYLMKETNFQFHLRFFSNDRERRNVSRFKKVTFKHFFYLDKNNVRLV